MTSLADRSICDDFARFQSTYPLQKVFLPRSNCEWCYFQAGSTASSSGRSGSIVSGTAGLGSGVGDSDTLIFIHGTSGVAAAFFYQLEALALKGYRVVSAQYPAYYTVEDWCKGFDHFLDAMEFRSIHIFGAGVGAFLAQHFAAGYPQRVRSLILCNGFTSTQTFADKAGMLSTVVHFTPTPLLRKVMMDSFPEGGMDLPAKQAIDWVASRVSELPGEDLAARLCLNCTASTVGKMQLEPSRITILESNGETMVPEDVRSALLHRYSRARLALLKANGDFPYLARPDEVILFTEVHLRGMGAFGQNPTTPSSALAEAEARVSTAADSAARRLDDAGRGESSIVWTDVRKSGEADPKVWRNPFDDDTLL